MGAIPFFNKLTDFCIYGTYDPLDLLAISAGALTAFFIGHMTRGGKTKEQTA